MFLSSIMKTVVLIALDFKSRNINKDDKNMTKKTDGICSKPTGVEPKWAKILKKNLRHSRKHVFAQLPYRFRDNSVSFSPNHFKFSVIG